MTITPYLCCQGASGAMQFYVRVFGATVREEIRMADGRIGHAELDIGGAGLMLADEFPEIGFTGSASGETSVMMHMHVMDARAVAARAEEAGARVLEPLKEDDGALRCKLRDPWGHVWLIESRL